jgi:signal recognition particle subunit SRP54
VAGEAGAASAGGVDRRAAPGGDQQLSVVAKQAGVRVHDPEGDLDPVRRASGALAEARNAGFDVVIVDTAGRLHIDDELMDELQAIKAGVQPSDMLYVADAMTGQDAIKSAGEFNRRIGVTGVVLTKMDGDARGGAALSVVGVVGVPIAFVGSGERLQDLEPFHPDRVVSRVLGMGDVLSLIEKAEEAVSAGGCREARREDPEERLHAGGLPRSAPDDQEDGAARADPRDAARAWAT